MVYFNFHKSLPTSWKRFIFNIKLKQIAPIHTQQKTPKHTLYCMHFSACTDVGWRTTSGAQPERTKKERKDKLHTIALLIELQPTNRASAKIRSNNVAQSSLNFRSDAIPFTRVFRQPFSPTSRCFPVTRALLATATAERAAEISFRFPAALFSFLQRCTPPVQFCSLRCVTERLVCLSRSSFMMSGSPWTVRKGCF